MTRRQLAALLALIAWPLALLLADEPVMYINNAVGTSDTALDLRWRTTVTGQPAGPSGLVIKNDAASTGPGLLITLDGTTTSATPTNNATQSTVLIRGAESVPFTATSGRTFTTLHFRADAAGAIGMRVILVQ